MFDRLIASESDPNIVGGRKRYFVVSSVVVGILFVTGVVISIFAAEYDLGNGQFELAELISPPDLATAPAPEIVKPRMPAAASPSSSSQTVRLSNTQSVEEVPTKVPDSVSTTPNTQASRPRDLNFILGDHDGDPRAEGSGRPNGNGGDNTPGEITIKKADPKPIEDETPPPAAETLKKPKPVVSKGPVNGLATSLPKPEYSPIARQVSAGGKVDVQVLINEQGSVVSAHAVNGHPLLRGAAESAARRAKFTPTTLGGEAVKVTGVITYNFVP
jgi:TonB family protein